MFFAIPAIGVKCSSSIEHRSNPTIKNVHTWSKLDKVGLALDIFLLANLCFAMALVFSAHYGVNLGTLKCVPLSFTGLLGATAALILTLDAIKALRLFRSKHSPEPNKEQLKNIQKPKMTPQFTEQDLSYFEISPALNEQEIGKPFEGIPYLKIQDSPFNFRGFGDKFEDCPIYYNAPTSKLIPTPLRTVLFVQSKDSQIYACVASMAIDTRGPSKWAWVLMEKPNHTLEEFNYGYDGIREQLLSGYGNEKNWWDGKIQVGLAYDLYYKVGLVTQLFPFSAYPPEQEEWISVEYDKSSGSFYLFSDTKEHLHFVCPKGAVLGEKATKTVHGSYGFFTVEVQEVKKGNKNSYVIIGGAPKPLKLIAA